MLKKIIRSFLLFLGFVFLVLTARAQISPAGGGAADGKFALVVGIDKYEHAPTLNGAVADARAMRELLTGDKFNFAPANVAFLYDADGTAEKILGGFRNLIQKARDYKARTGKEAVVVFHYSGHGSQINLPDGVKKADEPDDADETLVAVDSRDEAGKNFDILDDEIFPLVREMSLYTSNALYVFDSCHSGTVNRGTARAREVKADARPQARARAAQTRAPGAATDSSYDDFLVGGDKYVMISGSRSSEKSYEVDLTDTESRGALSFYLIRALANATATTTYRELMRRVAAEVNYANSAQNPQLSGAADRLVLGGGFKSGDFLIPVARKLDEKTVLIGAGKMYGVKEGALVAFYTDAKQKIAEGEVSAVENNRATVRLAEGGKAVSENDKAVLLSPLFGAKPVRVVLESNAIRSAEADSILKSVGEQLNPTAPDAPKLFEGVWRARAQTGAAAANDTTEFDSEVTVRRDKFREAFCGGLPARATEEDCAAKMPATVLDANKKTIPPPAADEEVFYLVPTAGGEPLFDFYVRTKDPKAAEKIVAALSNYARQKNLSALGNERSAAVEKLDVELLEIDGRQTDEGFVTDAAKKAEFKAGKSEYEFQPGAHFRLKITNNTEKSLYVTALNLSNDGGIKVMYPREAQEPLRPGASIETRLFAAGRPYGREQFKIVATQAFSDYSPLALGAVTRSGDTRSALNPLTRLMRQAVQGAKKRSTSEVLEAVGADEWGVKDLSFVVVR